MKQGKNGRSTIHR